MSAGPALVCFDGSPDAQAAIDAAAALLAGRRAVVLTVLEPVASWEPFDPGAIVSATVAAVGSAALGLGEIAEQLAHEKMARGVALARAAGLDADGRIAQGKPWRAICDVAQELDASVIVLGARGLSRVRSAVLGSVSGAVSVHAGRPTLIIPHA